VERGSDLPINNNEPLPGVLGNKGTGTFIFLGTGDIFKLFSGNKGTLE